VNNPYGSRFTVIYARPLALNLALDAFWNATHSIGTDSAWFDQYPNLANWNATTTAMGHSLGSNAALILGGMVLRACSPLNLTLGGDYLPLFDNATLCTKALTAGQLDSLTPPYNLRNARIGAVVALDPGPSYWFPPGNAVQSWFTDASFSTDFTIPLYLSSMTDSGGNIEAAIDSFPHYTATSQRVLVLQFNGSHNTYLNDCEYRILLGITGPSAPGCNASDPVLISAYHDARLLLPGFLTEY